MFILGFVPPLTFYSTSKVSFNEHIHCQHPTVFVIGWNHSTAWQLSHTGTRKSLPRFFHCKKWRAWVWLHFPPAVQKRARYCGICIPLRCHGLLCESCDGLMTCPGCNPACFLAETDSNPLINLNYRMKKKMCWISPAQNKTLSDLKYIFFPLNEISEWSVTHWDDKVNVKSETLSNFWQIKPLPCSLSYVGWFHLFVNQTGTPSVKNKHFYNATVTVIEKKKIRNEEHM